MRKAELSTVAFDLETHLITRARPAPKAVCMSSCGSDPERARLAVGGMYDQANALLVRDDLALVGHNVAYDMGVLMANFPEFTQKVFAKYKAGLVTDTGIRQQLFDIAIGKARDDEAVRYYTLAYLVKLIFDRDISEWKGGPDVWRLRYAELDGVPLLEWPEAAVEYPLLDARETWAVWNEQEKKAGDKIRDDAFQTYAAFCLHLMGCFGLRTYPEAVRELEVTWRAKLDELKPELLEAGLLEYQGPKKDPKRKIVKKDAPARERMLRVCQEKGIEPLLTDKGKELERKAAGAARGKRQYVAIDKAACFWADDELLKKRAQYVTAEKILSTYVPPLKEGFTLPITTRYGLAATTRTTSSSPGKNGPAVGTNLQNAPRDGGIRECFVPRPGNVYLGGDFSGAELHCLAQVCKEMLGYSTLGDVLKGGQDVHLFVAARLLGTTYEDAYDRYKQGDPDAKEARQHSKAANFGFGGSMGPVGFVNAQLKFGVRFSVEFATKLRNTWLAAFPEMGAYFERCKQLLGPKRNAVVELWPGGPLRRVTKLTTMANTFFQARAARGGKAAVCAVTEACFAVPESPLYRTTRPAVFVHDEILCETKDDGVAALDARAREFAKLMEDAFNEWVPDYPTTVDPVLMRRWYKGAEPAFDSKGRLVPWEPKK